MKTKELKAKPALSVRRRRLQDKREYVFSRLFELGMSALELARSEANYLPSILHTNESIGGVIAGQSDKGHMMIIATDKRVIVLDCKPYFTDSEDIDYEVVTGVTVSNMGPFYTVTLQSRLGDFKIYTLYEKAAKSFKEYLNESRIERLKESKEVTL